jgi:methylated-DNA-[protein]-cysteine S-methyltransferase
MEIPRQPAKAPTAFEARVYAVVRGIPRGMVATYGAVAVACGCGSARAVGRALAKNPFAPEVPCHRVVRADGGPGGFFGKTDADALDEKRAILDDEGVGFGCGGKVAEEFILRRL